MTPFLKGTMNEQLLNKISIEMQQINDELDELSKKRTKLKERQAQLIADWQKETK
jgi:outer membrane murein-binding lipoprotein Lpp